MLAGQRVPERITADGGIWKIILEHGDPTKLFPKFSMPGVRVKFQYRCFSMPFRPSSGSDATGPIKSGTAILNMSEPNKNRILVGESREPLEIELNRGFQVTGMELALKTMRLGERATFYCQPLYAEGYIQMEAILRLKGCRSGCVGCHHEHNLKNDDLTRLMGCPLEFELHLVDVLPPYIDDLQRLKSNADENYRSGKFREARDLYQLCLEQVGATEVSSNPDLSFEQKLRLNLAACHLKLKDYTKCIQYCSDVLAHHPDNQKALFRRAQASIYIADYETARQDLKLLRQQPNYNPINSAEIEHEWMKLTQFINV